MPEFSSNELLEQLASDIRTLVQIVQNEFSPLTPAELNRQPGPDRWSIAQCLEHLNSYGNYYIPLLEKNILQGEKELIPASPLFRSGWLGNYFTSSMRPQTDGSIALKMKAVKGHTPAINLDTEAVLNTFFGQQQQLLNLLERARRVNIQTLRVPISIAKFIRLSAGDTFRFLIAHEQRHVLQARRAAFTLILQPKISVEP